MYTQLINNLIVIIIIILPNKFKELVKFLERPTVAVALTVSYNISVIDAYYSGLKNFYLGY